MQILIFAAGVIVGFFGLAFSLVLANYPLEMEEDAPPKDTKGKAQFFEPITTQESFQNSKDLDQFLKNLSHE